MLLFVTLPNIHRVLKLFHSDSAINLWLLTTQLLLKYVATLHCDFSLMACFAINVSQGSVATYTRCGGIVNMHLTANLPR